MQDAELAGRGLTKASLFCARCGCLYFTFPEMPTAPCVHVNTADPEIGPEEAERIRARYAFGKLHNPDHDTTSYTDPPAENLGGVNGP